MSKIDAIVDILENVWDNEDVINAWNEKDDKHSSEEHIYYMDSFNELYDGTDPLDIVDIVKGRDFCTSDDYFAYDGYGRIESFSNLEDYSRFDYEELAEYLAESGDSDLFTTIDRDTLLSWFIDEYFPYDETLEDTIRNIIDDCGFDMLTDDWDVIDQEIRERTNADESDDDDE